VNIDHVGLGGQIDSPRLFRSKNKFAGLQTPTCMRIRTFSSKRNSGVEAKTFDPARRTVRANRSISRSPTSNFVTARRGSDRRPTASPGPQLRERIRVSELIRRTGRRPSTFVIVFHPRQTGSGTGVALPFSSHVGENFAAVRVFGQHCGQGSPRHSLRPRAISSAGHPI